MDDAHYIAEIQAAADGEVQGEVIFKALMRAAGAQHAHKLQALADLETRTGAEMQTLMDRYGLKLADSNAKEAQAFAANYDGLSWREILIDWTQWIPAYVSRYALLALEARPEDKPVLDYLAAHEQAIMDFINLELSGQSDAAMARVQSVLDRQVSSGTHQDRAR